MTCSGIDIHFILKMMLDAELLQFFCLILSYQVIICAVRDEQRKRRGPVS